MTSVPGIINLHRRRKALNEAGAEFPTEKLVVFIGSGGAGKTALRSMIARTVQKNEGEILAEGKSSDRWRNRDLAKHLSVLKQSRHLTVRVNVRELVSFGRFPYSQGHLTAEDEGKIDEAIVYMGLEHLTDRYLDELPAGQRQMAYIAMMIARDTKYLFLDEPLHHLDRKDSARIMTILRRLVRERGKTVMAVVQDIGFASRYADYIVAMKDGEIVAGGAVEEMRNSRALLALKTK